MESWYMLQRYTWHRWWYHITGASAQLLGSHWTKKTWASGKTAEEQEKNKNSTKLFLEFLHSSMDHPVCQWCRIYQLEEIWYKAGETPDELTEWIWGLAVRCNFPTDVEKGKIYPVLDGMCPQQHRPDQEATGYENWSNCHSALKGSRCWKTRRITTEPQLG